jgi:3-dehydroquinate dehydratase type I
MTQAGMVKATSRPHSVGVIFSEQDLQRALRLRKPPDLFELRLDGLVAAIRKLSATIPQLHAPVIITARAPIEGGANNLSLATRRKLLTHFLSDATFLDIELSSAIAFSALLNRARARNLQIILSLHNLTTTPALAALQTATRRAHSLGADIFKVAARTDRAEQLRSLFEFVHSGSSPIPVSAMGFGKLGRSSRGLLARAGSVLNYAHIGRPTVEGQWSLAQLRAATRPR